MPERAAKVASMPVRADSTGACPFIEIKAEFGVVGWVSFCDVGTYCDVSEPEFTVELVKFAIDRGPGFPCFFVTNVPALLPIKGGSRRNSF